MRLRRCCKYLYSRSVTAFRDPGVLPRHVDPTPEREAPEQSPFDIEPPLGAPKEIDVPLKRVDDGGDPSQGIEMLFARKWCNACQVYRPPRCSHCRSCDNCVDGLDHHCVFLNACIGRRNYTTFYAMLFHMLGVSWMGLVGCILHLYRLASPRTPGAERGFVHALKASPSNVAFFWLALVWMIPVACLFIYHTWLLLRNRSTVEQIRLETTHQLYDMHAPSGEWMHDNAVLRKMSACSAAIRAQCVPKDFATPPPNAANTTARARRRTPFQYANWARNAYVVLGRPVPGRYRPGASL